MKTVDADGMKVFQIPIFDGLPIIHGIFSRKGGVSKSPWASLNMGGTVGDERENVIINRERAFNFLGRKVETLLDVWQVHGKDILVSNQPRGFENPHIRADGIISNANSVTQMMRFADCVPLLFYAPRKHVFGLAHAGWKGTLNRIGKMMVDTFNQKFEVKSHELLVGIGPSIGPDHYCVGEDVVAAFKKEFGVVRDIIIHNSELNKDFLDLWSANRLILEEQGVEKIETSGICTACNISDWYSHRGEGGITGRFGVIMGIK